MSGAFCDGFKTGSCIFSIEDALLFLVSELKVALYWDSANTSFDVEYMLRQWMAASFLWMVMSEPWMSMPRELIKSWPIIISYRLILRSATCSDWLISLLQCSSGKLKLGAVLVLVVRTPAAVDHCISCLVFFIGSLSCNPFNPTSVLFTILFWLGMTSHHTL